MLGKQTLTCQCVYFYSTSSIKPPQCTGCVLPCERKCF